MKVTKKLISLTNGLGNTIVFARSIFVIDAVEVFIWSGLPCKLTFAQLSGKLLSKDGEINSRV